MAQTEQALRALEEDDPGVRRGIHCDPLEVYDSRGSVSAHRVTTETGRSYHLQLGGEWVHIPGQVFEALFNPVRAYEQT